MSRAVARRAGGLAQNVEIDGHEVTVDEPIEAGGKDLGPSPTRLLATSLASCTAITMTMYADRKGWNLDGLEVAVEFEGVPTGGDRAAFKVEVELPEGLDDEQRARMMVIAGKCPVHRVLAAGADIALDEAGASA